MRYPTCNKPVSPSHPSGCSCGSLRLTDGYIARVEALIDIVEGYKARNGVYPTGTTTDLIERLPSIVAELKELRAATAAKQGDGTP